MPEVSCHAGTLFCFTGNAVHTATNVEEGRERWTVQIYYYTNEKWLSDKRQA